MKDLFLHVGGTLVFTMLFLVYPYYLLRKRRSLRLYSDKLILYFCTELSFSSKLWPEYQEYLKKGEKTAINMPISATINGIFTYPLARAFLFVILITFSIGATIQLSTTFQLIQVNELYENFPFPILLIVCCAPIILFYLTSFSSESYSMMKNQQVVGKYMTELGWDQYPKEKLQQILKEVEVDYLLFKKNDDFGTILVILISGIVLLYSRIEKYFTGQQMILTICLFAVIVLSKSYYEGFRTRIIYIAINTLLNFINQCTMSKLVP